MITSTHPRRGEVLRWLLLAVGCLALSGALSLVLGISRMPWFAAAFTDPLLVRRALVVHVDLGVSVWFTAFPVAVLYWSLAEGQFDPVSRALGRVGFALAAVGIATFVVGGLFGGGEPVLSNYVPVVSNPLFLWGLAVYFLGCGLTFVQPAFWKRPHPSPGTPTLAAQISTGLRWGLVVGALYFLEAALAFASSALRAPEGSTGQALYELTMWAGGHVLQFVNVAFMLVAWTAVLASQLGRVHLSPTEARVVFGWLGFPLLVVPVLLAFDVFSGQHRDSFTYLMRWGLFPPTLTWLALVAPRALADWRAQHTRGKRDVRWLGVCLSVVLVLAGFVFGFLIQGPDLRVPGHYHATIGAVSTAYATLSFVLLADLGWTRDAGAVFHGRLPRVHAWAYGLGQLVFGLGMVIAGSWGMARKVYGIEQQIAHPMQKVGMGIMGVGGAGAALGGILFFVALWKWRRK